MTNRNVEEASEQTKAVVPPISTGEGDSRTNNLTESSAITTGELSEVDVAPARVAILSLVPVGYRMTRDEADAYARAAIVAYRNGVTLRASYSAPGSPVAPSPSNEGEVVNEKGGELAARLRERAALENTTFGAWGCTISKLLAEAADAIDALRRRVEQAERERDEARAKLGLLVDAAVYGDSYGVPGSEFSCCHFCTAGGAPGVPFAHDARCPIATVEDDARRWLEEHQDELEYWEKENTTLRSQLSTADKAGGKQMHDDLRRLAIDHSSNGYRCRVCHGEWGINDAEFHAKTCTAQLVTPEQKP